MAKPTCTSKQSKVNSRVSIYVNGIEHARMGVWSGDILKKANNYCCCHAVQFVVLHVL